MTDREPSNRLTRVRVEIFAGRLKVSDNADCAAAYGYRPLAPIFNLSRAVADPLLSLECRRRLQGHE
jgi:hypothetical protein